ncbi:MAG TPA: urease accessory protein UreD [Chthoniobacteraceae bacterium]
MQGHLELICAADESGRSYLRHQSFRAPIHLSKPHLDEGTLVVNVVNPTAGLLAGDRIRYDVQVEGGSRLMLTTPSANRVHQMRQGHAEVRQDFSVASGGWLENWPELMIPQGGARYRQQTTIRIEKGGGLLFLETVAPGRVASGESFAYAELDWATDLFIGDQHLARERYRLRGDDESLSPLREQFASGYYASVFVVAPELPPDAACWPRIHELHEENAWIGVSQLSHAGWVVKLLAADSIALRRKCAAIRAELYAALGRVAPNVRRT